MVEIHDALLKTGLTPDYRTDYVAFYPRNPGRGEPSLKLYYGFNEKYGQKQRPRVDVVSFDYPGRVAHRDPDWVQKYPQVKGELNLDGTDAEVLERVRAAGEFLKARG